MLLAANRLKHKKDFERIFKTGRWVGGNLVTIKYAPNSDGDAPKIGFMVGTKVSKSSVKRNLIKRRMREVVRVIIKKGGIFCLFDLVIVARPEIVDKAYHEIAEDINFALKKSKVLK